MLILTHFSKKCVRKTQILSKVGPTNLHWDGGDGSDGEVVIFDNSVQDSLKQVAGFNVVDHVVWIT